jgi:hypothetical protein
MVLRRRRTSGGALARDGDGMSVMRTKRRRVGGVGIFTGAGWPFIGWSRGGGGPGCLLAGIEGGSQCCYLLQDCRGVGAPIGGRNEEEEMHRLFTFSGGSRRWHKIDRQRRRCLLYFSVGRKEAGWANRLCGSAGCWVDWAEVRENSFWNKI